MKEAPVLPNNVDMKVLSLGTCINILYSWMGKFILLVLGLLQTQTDII